MCQRYKKIQTRDAEAGSGRNGPFSVVAERKRENSTPSAST